MNLPLRFLVVDEYADSRFLLVKTLLRKFPSCVVQECQHADSALAIAKVDKISAVVVHRTFEYDGVSLVALFRHINATLPIVMVSGVDRTEAALGAGANAFLKYDEWLRIGTVVAEAMKESATTRAGNPPPEELPLPVSAGAV